MENTLVVGGSGVTGNITSCRIENQLKSISKDSAVAFTQTSNYISYDVCSKTIVAEYSIPEVTGYGFFFSIPIFLLAIAIPMIVFSALAGARAKRKGTYGRDW